jgi:hypothetical protein
MNAKYVEVAERALAAANGNNKSLIFRSVVAENARVEAILRSLQANGGRVSSDRLIEASSAIGEAAVRLAEDLQRVYRGSVLLAAQGALPDGCSRRTGESQLRPEAPM